MVGVLDGIRVLDLSWGIAGPMTAMHLADNGADVVKIEPPGGDPFRSEPGYRVWQRGKRSAVVDLGEPAGRDALRALAGTADVVVESYAPGVAARLGADAATLLAANPRLVHCSITGYGAHGPLATRRGYDGLVAARTGLLYDQRGRSGTAMEFINGRPGPDPEVGPPEGMRRGPDRPGPLFPRSSWPSLAASYLATVGVTAALRAREVTGEGQRVETSLLAGALAAAALTWQRVENPDAPLYWMWPVDSRAIEGLFECADGRWVHHWTLRPNWVATVSAGETLEVPDTEHSYRADPDRLGMGPSDRLVTGFLYADLMAAFRRFPVADWVRVAAESGMGVAPVRSPAEALSDPAYLDDGCVVEVDDPALGPIRHVGPVIEFEATPGAVRGPAPEVGAHTEEVLAEAATAPAAPPAPTTPPAPTDPSGSTDPSGTASAAGGPLAGVRVLDLGLGVAGPFASRQLADLGADVVKVHALHDTFWAGTHMGLGTNRGKRSISLNLKDPRGIEVLHRLIDDADVLTMNWRPGAAARLGIDGASLRDRHPRLVFCNTRGYERGPRAALPGTDQTAAALTGIEWEDGGCDAGNPPLWSRSGMGDTGNAFLAAIGIIMALYHRDRSGRGQDVSTSIVNADLLTTSYAWVHADGTPGEWRHVDAGGYGLAPTYRMYEAADGHVFVAAVSENERGRLAKLLGLDTLPAGDALVERVAALVADRPARTAVTELDRAGVPAEIVDEGFCRELFDDPRWRECGLVSRTSAGNAASGGVGTFEDPGVLVQLSATPGGVRRGPCLCGEHTREIMLEVGYSHADVDTLVAASVVLDGRSG
jgi:crotonobetainyl-CoA:carnitine CoA-transferase CaiB-like acyl-CoA transferase